MLVALVCATQLVCAASFTAFESGQVRPMALSPDNTRLFVVNTPDNRLEIFDVHNGFPTYLSSVAVGMEPVAVAAFSNSEVWVVNYLSDSVSIVDVSGSVPRVVRTLLVGDEPADIVFAGQNFNRAFITSAHRGQNSPYTDPSNPGEMTTPGIGRADVWVFDANNPGNSVNGNPITILTLFGDTPKALSVTPDGSTVYAAVFKSGNQTTTLNEEVVCDVGQATPCLPKTGEQLAVGALPPPNGVTIDTLNQPEVGLIVKFDGTKWIDELGRDWSNMVRFNLPDKDVFAINANAGIPVESASFNGVGTVLFSMAVNPVSGKIYVANTEAINEVRFEGAGSSSTTVRGHLHESRITVIDPVQNTVSPVHLNKHIDYAVTPSPAGVKQHSLAIPKGIAVSPDGSTLYVVAKGSARIGVFDTVALENDSFTPDSNSHIMLSAGGPDGVVMDTVNNRLYVTTRFDNGLSIVDTTTNTEIYHITLHNPEPPSITAGRSFLYDADFTSSNGEASCASCHIEGDKDELAWDLGDPDGTVIINQNPILFTSGNPNFHPMKGPMTTQTLRGLANHGPMHWRGDRSGANSGGDALDEDLAFKEFNVAFDGLLGRGSQLTATEMQAFTDFILQISPPPNPIRALDDSLTPDQLAGQTLYFDTSTPTDGPFTCNSCHSLLPASGFFGTSGLSNAEETQHFKIPQLRNMYEKVGMFGMPDLPFFNSGDNGFKGDQIRGFGFLHDGSTDTLNRFFNVTAFTFGHTSPPDVERRQMEQFMLAFDSNLKPVVGQQITLDSVNLNDLASNNRIDLLINRALAGDADLIVKFTLNDEMRGAYLTGSGKFKTDKAADAELTDAQLRALASVTGQQLTYTAVPPGAAIRMGVDRDEDTVTDGDDNCPAIANTSQIDINGNNIGDICESDIDNDDVPDQLDNCPYIANLTQLDNDNDAVGDVCDNDDDNDGLSDVIENNINTDPFLIDSDGDGLSDFDEVNYDGVANEYNPLTDTNPLSSDTDNDGFNDDIEIAFGSNPLLVSSIPADGDINQDGVVDVVDILVTSKIVLGLQAATNDQLIKADVAPLTNGVPTPDGVINAGDFLLIQRKALGVITF